MKKRNHSIAGFSLVEVTLALGVASFSLLTFFGLLSVGVNSNRTSSEQTAATNILTSIVSDIRSTPNPLPKGSQRNSTVFGITIPASNAVSSTTPSTLYIGENAELTTENAARYRLTFWTTASTTTKPETIVRLLITWPAKAPYTSALGSVESVIALDRN
jgi:Tfp pilus assembly protein PilV